jgi:hypothetical protein
MADDITKRTAPSIEPFQVTRGSVVVALEVTLSDTAAPVGLGAMWVGCTPPKACTGAASTGFRLVQGEAARVAAVVPTASWGPQSVGPRTRDPHWGLSDASPALVG